MVAKGKSPDKLDHQSKAKPPVNTKKLIKFKGALNKSQKVFGVEFAPLSVPWERRKQTLATLTWLLIFLFTGPGGPIVLSYFLFFTKYWIVAVLYMAWIFYDRETCNTGGRRSDWMRNWTLWRYYKSYFPVTLVKTVDLDPKNNYLFCSHPHGILSSGMFACFGTEAAEISKVFPGIKMHILTLPLNFFIPFYREFCLALAMCSAKKESMNYVLSHANGGHGAILVPGGAPESLDSHPGSYIVQLKKRKGFIKVALQNGCHIVPIFCFGETDIYDQVDNPEGSFIRNVQDKMMRTLSFAPALFSGRGVFNYTLGLMPKRHPIYVVVGAPIELEKVEHPTQEQIDTLHDRYIKDLTNIFEMYKEKFADPGTELEIV